MRIGILGGAFDPVHSAHVALARAAVSVLALDKLLIVPSGEPPYKRCLASAVDRLQMARLAFRDVPEAEVSEVETGRTGFSYAVDTLRIMRGMYPGAEFVYILGADAAAKAGEWKDFDEISRMCKFAYAARGGAEIALDALRIVAELPNVSSSEVRAKVLRGEAIAGLVPAAVEGYIAERGLYLTNCTEEELIADLKGKLSARRFAHTLGVADTAAELARMNGISPGKARIAGLLHDCAKHLTRVELIELADAAGADADEKAIPFVLHAPVGAYLARNQYSVSDPEILCAVRRHTVGGRGMSLLDAVVYVADFIEPERDWFEGLDAVRALARTDIWRAVAQCARLTQAYAQKRGYRLHPATAEMINEIENGGRSNG